MTRPSTISCALLAAVAAVSSSVHAAPPLIKDLADNSRLDDRDRQDIRNYAEYWCERLAREDPVVVDEARIKLMRPLQVTVQVSDVFRWEYARTTLPRLEQVLGGDSPQGAVGALQVAGLLGTTQALDLMLDHCSVQNEAERGIRLWAAKSFPIAVDRGVLPDNDKNRALRQFGNAAGQETDWLILRRQFEAIASVDNNVSRDVQLNVLRATTRRMASVNGGPSDLMQAMYPALLLVRNEYVVRLEKDDQQSMGTALAPILCDLCSVANQHWKNAQNDASARASYGGAIQVSETLLTLIDAQVRPRQVGPRTQLSPAWQRQQKPRFEDDHHKWQAVLQGPPYNKNR